MNVEIESPGDINAYFTIRTNQYVFNYPCQSHSICSPYKVTIPKGTYKMQLWGGNGGPSNSNPQVPGGVGAYVEGIIFLYELTTLYLYIGAGGEVRGSRPTFGGGGEGSYREEEDFGGYGGGSGGGASDIRLIKGDDNKALESRISLRRIARFFS